MIQTDPIFLGVVPRGACSYVAREIARLGRPFFNACAGRFSVVEAVVKQGFPAANVHASDIGLFSSIIGYLSDPSKRLEDLEIRILDSDLEPRDVKDELDFAAHVMLVLKLNQMKQTNLRGLISAKNSRTPGELTTLESGKSLLAWSKPSRASTMKSPTSGMSWTKSETRMSASLPVSRTTPTATRRCSPARTCNG